MLTFFAQNIKSDFDKNKKKAKLLIFIILVFLIYVILVLPSVFRYGIGLDYFGDLNTITNYKLTGTFARTELITALFGKIVYEYNLDNHYYFVFFAIFTNLGFVLAIFINKDNKFLIRMYVLLCYAIYITSYNQVRQSFGVAFGMLAFSIFYNYRSRTSILIAYLVAIISALTHYSEIINLFLLSILYAFRYFNKYIKMKNLMITGYILIIISPIILMIAKEMLELIPIYNKYSIYLTSNDNSAIVELRYFGSFYIYIVPLVTMFYFVNNFGFDEDDYMLKVIFIYLTASIGFMFTSMLLTNLMFADRARTLIYGAEIISFPYLVDKLKGKAKKSYLIVTMLLMLTITIGTFEVGKMYPYRSIFNKDLIIY
ncbi:MAG: EpsG family protein [Candidatus Onthovivens sp.]|nr:EpsG family protein [Candidatus Onthovivens sp.]